MKTKNKIILMTIGLITSLLMVVGMTYSWFNGVVESSDSLSNSVIVKAANLGTIIFYNGEEINVNNVYPGWCESKIVSLVAEDSDFPSNYTVKLNIVENTLIEYGDSDGYITVETSVVSSKTIVEGGTLGETGKQNIIVSSGDIDIISGIIGPEEIHTYNVKFCFPELGVDQNSQQMKKFSGYLSIQTGTTKLNLVTLLSEDGGTVLGKNKVIVEDNKTVEFLIEAEEGYKDPTIECTGGSTCTINEYNSELGKTSDEKYLKLSAISNIEKEKYKVVVNNITASTMVKVNWKLYEYEVNINTNNESYGTVSQTSQKIIYGKDAIVTISPNTGYVYGGNDCGGTLNETELIIPNITENKDCTITFVKEETIFSYTGSYQTFEVPVDGTYKIELWGAGSYSSSYKRSYGAYVAGTISLTKGTNLYVYVGQRGIQTKNGAASEGGWNGGGTKKGAVCTGGGATDIRLVSGNWNSNLDSRIIVAAGAGGCGSTPGDGGLITGGTGTKGSITAAGGGTQTAGGKGCKYSGFTGNSGSFGIGGNANAACGSGGGGGWYGGGSGCHQNPGGTGRNCGAAGGSSYINGVSGYIYKSNAYYTSSQYIFIAIPNLTNSGKTGITAYNYQTTRGLTNSDDGYAIITFIS